MASQLYRVSKMECPNPIRLKRAGSDDLILDCKSWECPVCAAKKLLKYASATRNFRKVKKEDPEVWRCMITITYRERGIDGKRAGKDWNSFRTALAKRIGKFSYVRVVEAQRDGTAHFHVLVDRLVSARSVEAAWNKGFVKVTNLRFSGAGYVTKYVTKQVANWKRAFRVFCFSRDLSAFMAASRRLMSYRYPSVDFLHGQGCGKWQYSGGGRSVLKWCDGAVLKAASAEIVANAIMFAGGSYESWYANRGIIFI